MAARSINSPIVVSVKRSAPSSRRGDMGALVRASKSSQVEGAAESIAKRRRLVANFCLMLGDQAPEKKQRVLEGEPLSQRERQTLELLLSGHAEKQIAMRLNISKHTVHVYVKSLYKRFEVNSRGELLAKWVQQ